MGKKKPIRPKTLGCPEPGCAVRQDCESRLHTHYLRAHASPEEREGAKPHVCAECRARFFAPSDLRRHMRRHRVRLEDDDNFGCNACRSSFTRKDLYWRHLREVHEMTPDFLCEECGATFGKRFNLIRHIKMQHGTEINKKKKNQEINNDNENNDKTACRQQLMEVEEENKNVKNEENSDIFITDSDTVDENNNSDNKNKISKDTLDSDSVGKKENEKNINGDNKNMKIRPHPLDAVASNIFVNKLRRRKPRAAPRKNKIELMAEQEREKRKRLSKRELELKRQRRIKELFDLKTDDSLDLIVQHVQGKGLGVVAGRDFEKGEPVVEYAGDLITNKRGLRRERRYAKEGRGCYLFFFQSKNARLCVDGTNATSRKGRLINHGKHYANLRVLIESSYKKPRLLFEAKRDIYRGEEFLFNYGDERREVVREIPWLRQ